MVSEIRWPPISRAGGRLADHVLVWKEMGERSSLKGNDIGNWKGKYGSFENRLLVCFVARSLISNRIQSSKPALASFPAIDLDCAQSLIHDWPYICVGPTAVFFSVHFFHVKYLFLTSNYILTLTGYLVGVHMWCAQIIVTSFFSFLNFFPLHLHLVFSFFLFFSVFLYIMTVGSSRARYKLLLLS